MCSISDTLGYQTYQRFNGDPTEKENRWNDDGPTGYLKFAGKLTNDGFPDTSVAYLRWYWARLEPEKRSYRWEIIDRALEEADRRGQQLHIRVMPHGLRTWLPGDDQCPADELTLPTDAGAGTYELRLGIVRRGERTPVVRPANAGRTADGWLRLGKLAVEA